MNNRQAGRRRGRGGQRQGGNPGRPDNGNRIDNRARGNAAQLLEKYKNLAQDAQRSGDRVTTEYYLQFADHYFRVLAENRSRFEEQGQGRRQREDEGDEDGGEDFGFEGEPANPARYQQNDGERAERAERAERPRRDRDRDEPREARPRRDRDEHRANDEARDEGAVAEDAGEERPRRQARAPRESYNEPREERPVAANDEPRRRGRPRREPVAEVATEGFDAALLPPAISTESATGDDGVAERPRRGRPRKVRNDEGEAVPPAA
nr:DUF4167 domain-containing protein [Sphingomonas sp.]